MAIPQTALLLIVFLQFFYLTFGGTFRETFFRNGPCGLQQFRCLNDECIEKLQHCSNQPDCRDKSDESFCNLGYSEECPAHYRFFRCKTLDYYNSRHKCIPFVWKCDGVKDCYHGEDEANCTLSREARIENVHLFKQAAIQFLTDFPKRINTEKWGPQVHRIAVALHLASANLSHNVKAELAYETSIQLLSRLALKKFETITSSELSLFVNAFIVTCTDPRKFHGMNLVKELRERVNSEEYTNPYVLLTLCNAGEHIQEKDIEKLTTAFWATHTEFWTDTQAYAVMALACSASQTASKYDLSEITEMTLELKKKQFRNGTVDNLKTTALVMQALFAAETEDDEDNFDEEKAIKQILLTQLSDGSFGSLINTYYAIPVLNYKSLVNISFDHCPPPVHDEEKGLHDLLNQVGPKWKIQYSLWIGDQKDFQRVLKLNVPANTSLYNLMEMAGEVDIKFRFNYNVKNGKPYVYAISGIQDDPERGMFWFPFFEQVDASVNKTVPITSSPADIIPQNNQRIVYWYKSGSWK